jgi:hypothetical protein
MSPRLALSKVLQFLRLWAIDISTQTAARADGLVCATIRPTYSRNAIRLHVRPRRIRNRE